MTGMSVPFGMENASVIRRGVLSNNLTSRSFSAIGLCFAILASGGLAKAQVPDTSPLKHFHKVQMIELLDPNGVHPEGFPDS